MQALGQKITSLALPEDNCSNTSDGRLSTTRQLRESRIEEALERTERHLEDEDFHGWDPFDALCSPICSLPVLRSSRPVRFAFQQVVRRSPWNLRPLLRIGKRVDPVSLGLYIQGQALRAFVNPESIEIRRDKAEMVLERLAASTSCGFSGACWGYPHDWETRYDSIPAGTPTVVTTGIIANGLWTAYLALNSQHARDLLLSAAEFVMHDLNKIDGDDGAFCWSYSPRDRQTVLNATLKGSRLLAQAHALGGSSEMLDSARRSVNFVIAHQLPSGAWPYAVGDARQWNDHFHTGYVLECLNAYRRLSDDRATDAAIDKGWSYYRKRFFTSDLTPKYYDDRVDPLDATACAQAIITSCDFDDAEAALRVAEHAIACLGLSDGSFAYQRRRKRTVRTPFLRWSTSWMYCALSRLEQAFGCELASLPLPTAHPRIAVSTGVPLTGTRGG